MAAPLTENESNCRLWKTMVGLGATGTLRVSRHPVNPRKHASLGSAIAALAQLTNGLATPALAMGNPAKRTVGAARARMSIRDGATEAKSIGPGSLVDVFTAEEYRGQGLSQPTMTKPSAKRRPREACATCTSTGGLSETATGLRDMGLTAWMTARQDPADQDNLRSPERNSHEE